MECFAAVSDLWHFFLLLLLKMTIINNQTRFSANSILGTTRNMRRRANMVFARGADGIYHLQAPQRPPTLQEQLRNMFSALGVTFTGERRRGRFVNPVTNRMITIRNEADISRLRTRMLARTRFNRAAEESARRVQQERAVRRLQALQRGRMQRLFTFSEIQRSAECQSRSRSSC